MNKITKAAFALAASLTLSPSCHAQNPYMPLWEYIPDGEPYVFEDPDKPGEYRIYVYGSHDSLRKYYCGLEQVAWSASINDLKNWRYDGICFEVKKDAKGNTLNHDGKGDLLYAPDMTMKIGKDGRKEYYLYPNDQYEGRRGMVAMSHRPDGPFEVINWSKSEEKKTVGPMEFDPACFVDDDGRVYGYWGFEQSWAAELDPETMSTVKPGTQIIKDMIPNYKQDDVFRFFEASSMRKIKDKYIFIYSRFTKDGEFGMPMSNYTLAYAYSDNPLGPWTYGGTIIDGRARDVDDNGNPICTANPYGNTHGSIQKINGRWWVFYHRQTGTDEYSRQAMVAPIEVNVEEGKGGKVTISEAEYNSEGFMIEGLNPLNRSLAGWACYYTNPDSIRQEYPNFYFTGSYIKATRIEDYGMEALSNLKIPYCPVVNNTSGSVVGYKYFNFNHTTGIDNIELMASIKPEGIDGNITVMVGGPNEKRGGKAIGEFAISKNAPQQITEMRIPINGLAGVKGKQPLFFVFNSATKGKSICELYDFQFVK